MALACGGTGYAWVCAWLIKSYTTKVDAYKKCDELDDPKNAGVRKLTAREVVAQLYRHSWQVELFFRCLKCILG